MKHLFIGAFALISLLACKPEAPEYHIEGNLPSDRYDGEWIYLAPLGDTSADNIDSTRIENARFTFRGTEERLKVLRMRVPLRLKLQELLVITEPGVISVRIDSISSASGTPQNDVLQEWKEFKERTDRERKQLWSSLQTCTQSVDTMRIINAINSLRDETDDFNRAFLKELPTQTLVGTFLNAMIRPTLPEVIENRALYNEHDEYR